jgi:uncharacterized membrane protein
MPSELQNEPAKDEKAMLGMMASYTEISPLPPPEYIDVYEKHHKGAMKIFLNKFSEEQDHRHEIEKADSKANADAVERYYGIRGKEVRADFVGNISSQLLSAAICLAGLGACVYLAMNGHTWEAVAVVAIPFAGIIRAMRSGKR